MGREEEPDRLAIPNTKRDKRGQSRSGRDSASAADNRKGSRFESVLRSQILILIRRDSRSTTPRLCTKARTHVSSTSGAWSEMAGLWFGSECDLASRVPAISCG